MPNQPVTPLSQTSNTREEARPDLKWYAHSKGHEGLKQPLHEHLLQVGALARQFAAPLGPDAQEEAFCAGIAHDLGKYSVLFQNRLLRHQLPDGVAALDHGSPGAKLLAETYGYHSFIPALIAHGHHIGLRSREDLANEVKRPRRKGAVIWSETDLDRLKAYASAEGIQLPEQLVTSLSLGSEVEKYSASTLLMVRMIYSCVVDADYLDTEAHFHGGRRSGASLQSRRALDLLDRHIRDLRAGSTASTQVDTVRKELRQACLDAAESPKGTFTLTAPTGSGKTLAMLAFALRHAEKHGLERIIFVLPYLSIIDQTAQQLRDLFTPVFGTDYVLEHHSGTVNLSTSGADASPANQDPDDRLEARRKELTENWDAPIIVTTSVQCLESLFANRPGACRKLHNMANAVLLFDEVQTLPPHLSVPTLGTLDTLARKCNSTVLFSTATQPAFEHLGDLMERYSEPRWRPAEIVPEPARLFEAMKRVQVTWPGKEDQWTWEETADRIVESPEQQALVIVNLRRHTHTLFGLLEKRVQREALFHLSTTLCAGHREDVLKKVRDRLADDLPCILVSTQCVEAGVDLSFPVVYRAFGPLDSIAQAAGRCNRHGETDKGRVVVFTPQEEEYPGGVYKDAAGVAGHLVTELDGHVDLDDPATHKKYFEALYDVTNQAEPTKKISEAHQSLDFPVIAGAYKIIPEPTARVLVAWRSDEYRSLCDEVRRDGLTRDWVQRAQPHAVSILLHQAEGKLRDNLLHVPLHPSRKTKWREFANDWFVAAHEDEYDEHLGWVPGVQQDSYM